MKTFDHLAGCDLEAVIHDTQSHEWVFAFTRKIALQVSAPWRITVSNEIRLGFEDHEQLFGLAAPLDIQERLSEIVIGRRVNSVHTSEQGDLTIQFEGETVLWVFNSSMGYEGWILNGPGNKYVVGQGGGRIVESNR